jgi:LuxR family maltose regulon positive regulatory protein
MTAGKHEAPRLRTRQPVRELRLVPPDPFTAFDVPRRELFMRLERARRVTTVSGPAGSGKTCLLKSWIREAGVGERAAWVTVPRAETDPQRFWLSVLDALRKTTAAPLLVDGPTAAPDLGGAALAGRLTDDLASLPGPLWLVIDDLHELHSSAALGELELWCKRAPAQLRVVLLSRHDPPPLGLHRLRLEGALTEIRAADLRFTHEEASALLAGAGVRLSESAMAALVERAEGWAAGLRMAALSLTGHADPESFAAGFSGRERIVSEYLLAEVLAREPENVRRLLLRTSVLERVNGPLADLLTGGSGGERALHELEHTNAFVAGVDEERFWFRYQPLLADALRLELRRTEPGELPALHGAAAHWHGEHGYPVEAIRHAQAAGDWALATRLLCDHWFGLVLDGHAATAHELLAAFPGGARAGAELTAVMAGHELNRGSLEEGDRYLALAARGCASVPAGRRGHFQVTLAVLRLHVARQRGDLPAVVEEAQRLLTPAENAEAVELWGGDELRAFALISRGITELWMNRCEQAERRLEQGIALAHRIGRPYLEITGLAHRAMIASFRSLALGADLSIRAIELARKHGWTEEPIAAVAYAVRGGTMLWQGRFEQAQPWLDRAARTLPAEVEPAAGVFLHGNRGFLELAHGRLAEAVRAFQAAERLAELLVTPHKLGTRMRACTLHTELRRGETDSVRRAVADLDDKDLETAEMRTVVAALALACDDAEAATVALAPVLDRSVPVANPRVWVALALLLEASARDALRDAGAVGRAVERALDLVEPQGIRLPFLLHPAPALLERHRRSRTSHGALVSEILGLLAGTRPTVAHCAAHGVHEPLSESETRVLRYLPTNLSNREIADEIYVSVNTVKAHIRHLYAKLGTHRRAEAVERARALGLLAPSARHGLTVMRAPLHQLDHLEGT